MNDKEIVAQAALKFVKNNKVNVTNIKITFLTSYFVKKKFF